MHGNPRNLEAFARPLSKTGPALEYNEQHLDESDDADSFIVSDSDIGSKISIAQTPSGPRPMLNQMHGRITRRGTHRAYPSIGEASFACSDQFSTPCPSRRAVDGGSRSQHQSDFLARILDDIAQEVEYMMEEMERMAKEMERMTKEKRRIRRHMRDIQYEIYDISKEISPG